MKKAVLGTAVLALLSLSSLPCYAAPVHSSPPLKHAEYAQHDSSQTSVDWHGVYQGTLPCTDCDGVETTLILRPDHTYTLHRRMLGEHTTMEDVSGSFAWAAGGGVVMLNETGGAPNFYKIGEEFIWQLDSEGQELKSPTPESYALKKVSASTAPPLEGTRWSLVEIGGSPVLFDFNGEKLPHFILGQDGSIQGFGGCNPFSGKYEHQQEDRFDLFELTATMMACEQLETEQKFLQALEIADRYQVVGVSLFLYHEDALLARLVAGLSGPKTP